MKKLKQQEIEPGTFEIEKIQPEIFTSSQILELLQSKGLIYEARGGYALTKTGLRILKGMPTEREEIVAYGHENITATHLTTFEVTRESHVGKKGTCIIGVRANKACSDLDEDFKKALKEGKKLLITLKVDGITDIIEAMGSPALELTNDTSIVVRKSDFIDDRTLAILANKAANDIKRELIEKMKNPKQKMRIILEII